MDSSSLTDNVFLKIFRYLPFKERVRAGRVNSAFRRVSKMAISETKELEIQGGSWSPLALNALLNVCADKLEEIRFSLHRDEAKPLLEAFSEFYYPNLTVIQCTVGGEEILRLLLRNTPNLKSLLVDAHITYPDNIISEQLETLRCWCCDEQSLRSLTGRVPNLKHLDLHAWFYQSPIVSLDGFLGTVPHLETLQIRFLDGDSCLHLDAETRMGSFWRLNCLTELQIYSEDDDWRIGDGTLMKMAKSFPRLRIVRLPGVSTISNDSLVSLSSLTDLEELELDCEFPNPVDLSAGVRALSTKCGQLRKLRFIGIGVRVSQSVLTQLFHSCPQLSMVDFWDVVGVESEQESASVLRSFAGSGKRVTCITLHTDDTRISDIWCSRSVVDASDKLRREYGIWVALLCICIQNTGAGSCAYMY